MIEIAGLLLVIVVGAGSDVATTVVLQDVAAFDWAVVSGVLAGSILAFYAFLGFEDMVNVAEEVRDAPRVMPRAIIITLVVTGLLYIAVATVAVRVVPLNALAGAEAPLALVYQAGSREKIVGPLILPHHFRLGREVCVHRVSARHRNVGPPAEWTGSGNVRGRLRPGR